MCFPRITLGDNVLTANCNRVLLWPQPDDPQANLIASRVVQVPQDALVTLHRNKSTKFSLAQVCESIIHNPSPMALTHLVSRTDPEGFFYCMDGIKG